MHTEYEVRVLEIDVSSIKKKLDEVGATFEWDRVQRRYVYDFIPKVDSKWIRLRTNGVKTTLTIKDLVTSKIDGTRELEIEVDDFDNTNKILEELGYVHRNYQENRRIQYILDNVEIDIDFWPMIPPYVEFEGKSTEDIIALCKKLDIDFDSLVTLDVTSIYEHYGIPFHTVPAIISLEDEKKNLKI